MIPETISQEVTGIIFDIDHFAVHDGPGIRSVIYFKGCPLRCLWCHSPESLERRPEPVYIKEKCKSCISCAGEGCPYGAQSICGRTVSVNEIVDEILSQRTFFVSSGGGVTFSGGEPLFQPEFITAILRKLHKEGIHTITETSMMCDADVIKDIYEFTDTFYCDVKMIDPVKHKLYTGHDNITILSNIKMLSKLRDRQGIVLRIPLIPGYTDAADDIAKVYRFAGEAGLSEIHLLPYNPSAPAKYEWLSIEYKPGIMERQSSEYLDALITAAPAGLNIKII